VKRIKDKEEAHGAGPRILKNRREGVLLIEGCVLKGYSQASVQKEAVTQVNTS